MTLDNKHSSTLLSFDQARDLFVLPDGVIYLDGNSLGPLPKGAVDRVHMMMTREWGEQLIGGWNIAGWYTQPRRIGDRIARLIGAEDGTVVMGDTLSIKVYQALASALELNPSRKLILSDTGNFPSDLYMAQGLIKSLGRGHELKTVAPEELMANITTEVAVVMVTEVDYRTGARHDMAKLIERAHAAGALVIWDLAHSAGAFPVDVAFDGADFAVGCTYKYLNGGPGAPAFIYVAPRHAERVQPALSGWMGHGRPFAFVPGYEAGAGIERMRVGTPPVLALAALEASLDIWERIDLTQLRQRSLELTALFMDEVLSQTDQLALVTPREPDKRGSQVSFAFHEGYAAIQALAARGVIGDFRAPNIMRFGICPLYNSETDIRNAANKLIELIKTRAWDNVRYKTTSYVT